MSLFVCIMTLSRLVGGIPLSTALRSITGLFAAATVAHMLPAAIIAPDPFAAAIATLDTAQPPEIVEQLETIETGEGSARITTSRFTFRSRDGANTLFAILVRPVGNAEKRRPALLFFHGGGSRAEANHAVMQGFAREGYVALACDLPGICAPAQAIHSSGPWRNASSGEAARFTVTSGEVKSTLVDAEIAALDAFRLLRSQPDVDPARIGLNGYSWGGYTTTFVAGLLGPRIRAAYSFWGCGYYDEGSYWLTQLENLTSDARDTWLAWLDAGRRASGITAPYFIEGATNDTYFWPPAVDGTLAVVSGVKNRVWWPNLHHAVDTTAAPTRKLFFDYYLKGIGQPFGTIAILSSRRNPDGTLQVISKASIPPALAAIDSVKIYYSPAAPTWKERVWTPRIATLEGDVYVADLPAVCVADGLAYYAQLTDSRRVSTSSAVTVFTAQSIQPPH